MNKKYTAVLSLFVCFTLFLFAPLEVYFSIYEDVWFDITHMIGLVLLCFGIGMIGCYIALFIISKISDKWYAGISTLLFSMVLASYIQGNFLVSSFGTMDGEVIDWSSFKVETIVSVLVWVIIIGGCLLLLKVKGEEKFQSGAKVIMICIILIQTVTLGTVCLTTDGLKDKSSAAFLDRNVFTYSSNDNVIVLLLDMYDSRVFQAIYDESGNEEYIEMLDGFTYYPDTVGAYSLTHCAIPHILTGEKYNKDMDMKAYINDAYVKSPLMTKLQKEEYSINLYTNEAVPNEKDAYKMISNYLPEEESHTRISSKSRFLACFAKLIGIRYLPQPLKQYCWFYSEEIWGLREVDYQDGLSALDNFGFYNGIEEIEVSTEQNMFHFYHLDGMHIPCYYDENMERTAENLALDGYNGLVRNGKGMMILIRRFIEKLKEEGIYEDSAIVIMADHGGRFYAEEQDEGVSRANPLLLVKGFGEEHPLQVSEKAISYDDLQTAFGQLIDGVQGENIFTEIEDKKNRERYFTNTTNFVEYYTTGHASDIESYEKVE